MSKDILSELESLETSAEKPQAVTKVTKEAEVLSGRVDYDRVKEMAKKQPIYAVKNVGKHDLIVDWDLSLMPEDLKGEFDQYLSQKYLQYEIQEVLSTVKLVAVLVAGKTVNFLFDFMSAQRIPVLSPVQEGPSTVVRSQFLIPAGVTVLCTETQMESLRKFLKRRHVQNGKASDWFGVLAAKEITPEKFHKVGYSMVHSEDIRNNGFETRIVNSPKLVRKSVAGDLEFAEEIDL